MSKLCTKISCPNRVSIGKENDSDVLNYICPKCELLFYVSETRSERVRKRAKPLLGLLVLIIILLFTYRSFNKTTQPSTIPPTKGNQKMATKPVDSIPKEVEDEGQIKVPSIKDSIKREKPKTEKTPVKNDTVIKEKLELDSSKTELTKKKPVQITPKEKESTDNSVKEKEEIKGNLLVDMSPIIRDLIKAEEQRNFYKLKGFYSENIIQYGNKSILTHDDLKRIYVKEWAENLYSSHILQRIDKIDNNTYVMSSKYTFYNKKVGKPEIKDMKIKYIFNFYGKIIQAYPIL